MTPSFSRICLVLSALSVLPSLPLRGQATVSVQPSKTSVNPGDSVTVALNLTGVANLYAFQVDLTFNASVLSAGSVAEGSLLPTGGATYFIAGTINNTAGTITANADTLQGPVSGVTGTGSLVVASFTTRAAGAVTVNFANLTLLDSNLNPISYTGPTSFTISPTSINAPYVAGTGIVNVTTSPAGLSWSASSNAAWLTITSGLSGTGNGAVGFSVAANSGAQRAGTLTIAGLTFTVTQAALGQTAGLLFVPVTPCRVMDTRGGSGKSGAFGAPFLVGGTSRDVPIPQSGCAIPSNALGYSLNVTVVPPGPLTYLSIWPTGQPQPLVSTLNSFDGRIVANAAIVPAGSSGSISVFVSNDSNVIIDINGYFAPASTPSSLAFYPVTPCRVADTRGPTDTFGGPFLSGNSTRSFPIPGSPCGIPGTAQAYSFNFTVVPHQPLSYLTTWPTGQTQPLVSTLNSFDGSIVANAAIVPAGTNGAVSVFVTNDSEVIIDINGYFAPPGAVGAEALYTVTPCRVVDTRGQAGTFGGPILSGGSTRSFPIPGSSCGITTSAQAYSLNVTVVPQGPLGYLTAWPAGQTIPLVSTLNSPGGKVLANAAIVPAGTIGSISVFVTNNTDLILDINAFFAP